MHVGVEEITRVRFVRELHPYPSYSGPELLAVQFLEPGVRERYGNRDESRVDHGTLLAQAA